MTSRQRCYPPLPEHHCRDTESKKKLTLSNASCNAPLRARVLASMGIPTLPQVPPGPNRGEAGPTCDRGFPCTRMWRQTSSRRASPDSILSCGHGNVRPVTRGFHTSPVAAPVSLFLASVALRMPKKYPSHYRADLYELPL